MTMANANLMLVGDETRTDGAIRCPNGHAGPFRYVESIKAWRWVRTITKDDLIVSGRYATGEGYDDGEPDTAELECHHYGGVSLTEFCGATFPLPRPVADWRD